MSFAERCGVHGDAHEAAVQRVLQRLRDERIERVRFSWCDSHGMLRGKTLMASQVETALRDGVGMVGTLMLKDSSDRTAWKVFEPGATADLPGFSGAANLLLLAEPDSLTTLPWSPGTAWLRCQPWHMDGQPVAFDTRRVLQQALERLASHGLGLRTGLEVEFHIYRITDDGAQLDPERAAWPGEPPALRMIHPGYNLQAETCMDMADEALTLVQQTAQALGLPLQSLEIELGPSQVEAVFDATDALRAADDMVRFRNGVRQALRRAGYWATFMCRPPFPHIMSSGWHLHQSVYRLADGHNAFMRDPPPPGSQPRDAEHTLSELGAHWLAGLLAHAKGMAVLCTPTANGFGRFRPNALAPQSVLWGLDNRGAMLRVVGGAGQRATRIENRLGEPAANPYLYMAAQIHAGLDGLERALLPPPATEDPYAQNASDSDRLPTSLAEAIDAFEADAALRSGLGEAVVHHYARIKRSEAERHAQAQDVTDFERREYLSRI